MKEKDQISCCSI